MSITIPAYSNACLSPDATGKFVYLVGVSASNEGCLEMTSIDLTNINSPTATIITNQTLPNFWSSSAPKACLPYSSNQASTNSPVSVQQFGPNSYFTNIYPNGTIGPPASFPDVFFLSNKLFSLSAAVGGQNWITAVANTTGIGATSPWIGAHYNAMAASSADILLTNYPTAYPSLSVGTYVASSNTAQGHLVVFDANGAGSIYTTLGANQTTPQNGVVTLSTPEAVDMNGITLTSNAFSLTMIGVGYILDKATDGTTVMYSINPSQSTKLQRVSVSGNVPSFSGGMAAASVGNKIVTYSAASNNAVTFNSFDTVALDWSGPGLVNGSNSGSSSSSVPVGAIVGGVVGGLAVIALVAFLFIRHRRASKKISGTADVQPRGANEDPTTMSTATAPLMEQKTAIQQQQQQDIYSAQPLTTVPLQQQTQPKIFQPQTQESYNYVPPTLILESPPQPQPNIFRAQESSPYSDYSQAGYVSPTSGATPQTPSSQLYTPAYPSNTGANPQYIPPSNGDGYVE